MMQTLGSVTVRPAGPDDAAAVLEMLLELAADQGQTASVAVTAHGLHELVRRDDVVVLLAERDGRPVGYVSAVRQLNLWAGGDIVALDDLYVRAEARNAGVGRQLMLAVASVAAADGLIVRWEAETSNERAQRFYARLGARLRTKVIAAWTPDGYAPHLDA